jgi:hypothetical protein
MLMLTLPVCVARVCRAARTTAANYCFSSMYFTVLLHHGYGIDKSRTPLHWYVFFPSQAIKQATVPQAITGTTILIDTLSRNGLIFARQRLCRV